MKTAFLHGCCHWETTKCLEFSFVFQVNPVMGVHICRISRTLNFENVIPDEDRGLLDVTPETNKLGSDLNVQTKTISKLWIFGKNQVALSVVFKVLLLPGPDCKSKIRQLSKIKDRQASKMRWTR